MQQKKLLLKFLYRLINFSLRISFNFNRTDGFTRAGSLAFTLLLSFVPFAISILSILSYLPVSNQYIKEIEAYLFSNYLPHGGLAIYHQLQIFLRHAKHLSYVGLSFLLITTYVMFFAIERQLNAQWDAPRTRTLPYSFLMHSCFLIYIPIIFMLIAFIGIYSYTHLHTIEGLVFFGRFLVILFSWVMFSMIYKLIPSHRVSFKNALIAGFIASILFYVGRKLFIFYTSLVIINYHIIYGSLALFPITLIWIYLCCFILLYSAEIIYGLESKFNPNHHRKLIRFSKKLLIFMGLKN